MTRTLAVGLLVAGLAATAAAAEVRVGFVNMARLLQDSPQATDASAKIEQDFSPREREMVSTQKDVRQLEDRLLRDGPGMTDVTRGSLELDLRNRKRELKRQQDEFREDLNLRKNQELASIQRLVIEAIQSLAKKESYDLVLTEGVVFASSRVDITDKVLERLKQEAGRRDGGS
jgi:outer membrane protein